MNYLKECTEQEFKEFLARYPRKLEMDVYGAFEPPLVTYNDWTLGDWPKSVVAAHSAGDPPGVARPFYGEPKRFRIREGDGR